MIEVTRIPPAPARRPDAHKGHFGHTLVLAGSRRMSGAALLTTLAALRSGTGLVTLGMPAGIQVLVAPAMLEAMSFPLPHTAEGSFSRDAIQPALDFSAKVTAVALGPGITTDDETAAFATRVAQRARPPLVLDADGLNCLAKQQTALRAAPAPRVLTPHPGEAARLLDRPTADIQADRTGAAAEIADKFGAVAVLKGRGTIVTDGERVFRNRTGNPGMASGGSGDVLTGVIAGLLAQGMDVFDGACLGAHVHGRAGDLAAKRVGETSLIARDMLDALGEAFLAVAAR